MIPIDLEGKTALITGAGRGIGKHIALKFSRAGSNVAVFDVLEEEGRQVAENISSSGVKGRFYKVDVTREEEISRAVDKVLDEYGRIDFFINNAGITTRTAFTELSLPTWQKIMDVNLKGAFLCSKKIVPHLIEKKQGRIVFISSGSAITGSGGGAHYASSKGGINSLTRALARELAPYGILVNTVAPRNILAESLRDIYTDAQLKELAEKVPIKRLGTPQEIANVALFLCSGLSTYMTGQILLVDGGRTFSS